MNGVIQLIKNQKLSVKITATVGMVIIAGVIWVGFGYYPVAMEGWHFIGRADFERNYRAASFYYSEVLRKTVLAESKDEQILQPADIGKAVLEQLVGSSIVKREARREWGGGLAGMVQKKIAGYGDDSQLREAAKKLYNLDYADFKRDVLVPQAERDILAAQFFLRGENFEEWLETAKKSAKVRVFLSGLRWEDGAVK